VISNTPSGYIPFNGGGPFTAEELQKIIGRPRKHPGYILPDRYVPPRRSDIELLALMLNDMTGAFRYAKEKTGPANALAEAIATAKEAGVIEYLEVKIDHALLMPEHKTWRSIANAIAGAFMIAMQRTNPNVEFGYSSSGNPVTRFVAAVVPMMTGEEPAIGAVSKYLQRQARQTGTNGK
jgi:hypothetical protein